MCFTQYPLLTVQSHWSVVANSFKLIPALGTQYQLLPLPGMIFLLNFSQVSVQILLFLVGDSFSPSCLQWFLVLPHLHISISYRSYFTAQHLSYLNFFVCLQTVTAPGLYTPCHEDRTCLHCLHGCVPRYESVA